MTKPVTQIPCYAAIFMNGKLVWSGTDPIHMQQQIIAAGKFLLTIDSTTAKFSTAEIKFSRHPIHEEVDDFIAGLDPTLITYETEPPSEAVLAALAQAEDPQWLAYMSINSSEDAANMDPQELGRLRTYISVHYPNVPLRW